MTDQVYVAAAPCTDGTDMQKVDPIAWKRGPKGPFSLGSREIARANGRQLDENDRFEGGSVLDRAESEGLFEKSGNEGQPARPTPWRPDAISCLPHPQRHGQHNAGNRERHAAREGRDPRQHFAQGPWQPGAQAAVGAVIRAKTREPELPWRRVVDPKLHPTRAMEGARKWLEDEGASPAGTDPLILAFAIRGSSDRDKGPPGSRVGRNGSARIKHAEPITASKVICVGSMSRRLRSRHQGPAPLPLQSLACHAAWGSLISAAGRG